MSSNIIILTGIPGSGKTTILNEVIKEYPLIKVVNFGEQMMSQASLQGIDRDLLRKLPLAKQQEVGMSVANKIAYFEGLTIVDTHTLIKTPLGYYPGLPEHILKVLRPCAIAVIESHPMNIYERRKQDTVRRKDLETIEDIEHHQNLCRAFLTTCSAFTGAILTHIPNNRDVSESVKILKQLIDAYKI